MKIQRKQENEILALRIALILAKMLFKRQNVYLCL